MVLFRVLLRGLDLMDGGCTLLLNLGGATDAVVQTGGVSRYCPEVVVAVVVVAVIVIVVVFLVLFTFATLVRA